MGFTKRSIFLALHSLLIAACRPSSANPSGGSTPTVTSDPTIVAVQATPINFASQECENPVPSDRRFPLPPWPRTNFCRHSVPYQEIRSGGVGRDRIAAIDQPKFETIEEANIWLADVEPVLVLELDGDARAYPLQIMVWHEIVNDAVAGRPVLITYCPLCSSGLVFDRRVNGQPLDFGTTGNLRNSDLIMYDRQTESWWQQFTAESIVGQLTGTRLTLLPSGIVSWAEFKSQFPCGRVLSTDTGSELLYGETPYLAYDALTGRGAAFFDGPLDERLPPKMRVMALKFGRTAIAYPYSLLSRVGVINDTVDGQDLVIFWQPGTTSALYKKIIAESRDVGSSAAFSRRLSGRTLTFTVDQDDFHDAETGSTWNLFGTAVAGPLSGQQLTPLPGHEFLWFAWAAFQPDTLLYEAPAP